jgi:ABC-type branched-subunit amino acid transport system ATPase component
MDSNRPYGLYLLKKEKQDGTVLKELLQLLRTVTPSKGHSFSYIEASTSLHPNLSLWENLQIELGPIHWNEFHKNINSEWKPLANLLRHPDTVAAEAQTWERFLVSLLKGFMLPTQNLLIDVNEEILSPLLIQNFKKTILEVTKDKNVFLASANSSLWLDCAHSMVGRSGYKFEIEALDLKLAKKSVA